MKTTEKEVQKALSTIIFCKCKNPTRRTTEHLYDLCLNCGQALKKRVQKDSEEFPF